MEVEVKWPEPHAVGNTRGSKFRCKEKVYKRVEAFYQQPDHSEDLLAPYSGEVSASSRGLSAFSFTDDVAEGVIRVDDQRNSFGHTSAFTTVGRRSVVSVGKGYLWPAERNIYHGQLEQLLWERCWQDWSCDLRVVMQMDRENEGRPFSKIVKKVAKAIGTSEGYAYRLRSLGYEDLKRAYQEHIQSVQ